MKDKYRKLCEEETSIPLFSQSWWLDSVAGDSWEVVLIESNKQIVGSLPYVLRKKAGFKIISQPTFTQSTGPWIRPSDKSYSKHLGYEKDVLERLIELLPHYHHYAQSWSTERKNWLPFFWHGFEQTTKYTYRLNNIRDIETTWNCLQPKTRSEIRKAQQRFELEVKREPNLDCFFQLYEKVYQRQNKKPPYSREFLDRVHNAASVKGAADCFVAFDKTGMPHAGVYVVRNADIAYYMLGGANPELRTSGAQSLALWTAITNQPDFVSIFDFEGSMIRQIESYFRSYGAILTPYFHVTHTPSLAYQFINFFKNLPI